MTRMLVFTGIVQGCSAQGATTVAGFAAPRCATVE